MLDKVMSIADASINVGIKLISLAIVLQVVFGHSVPFLGGNVIGTIIGIVYELGSAVIRMNYQELIDKVLKNKSLTVFLGIVVVAMFFGWIGL